MGQIYKITNRSSNKAYIGKTVYTGEKRWKAHCSSAKQGSRFRFHSAIRKHGIDAFDLEILENCSNDDLADREEYWILKFKTNEKPHGYNANTGRTGGFVVKDVEQWKQNMPSGKGHLNNHWGGVTNDQMIQEGVRIALDYGFVPGYATIRKIVKEQRGISFPKAFSSMRFGGCFRVYLQEIQKITNLKINIYYRSPHHRKLLSEAIKSYSWYNNGTTNMKCKENEQPTGFNRGKVRNAIKN